MCLKVFISFFMFLGLKMTQISMAQGKSIVNSSPPSSSECKASHNSNPYPVPDRLTPPVPNAYYSGHEKYTN